MNAAPRLTAGDLLSQTTLDPNRCLSALFLRSLRRGKGEILLRLDPKISFSTTAPSHHPATVSSRKISQPQTLRTSQPAIARVQLRSQSNRLFQQRPHRPGLRLMRGHLSNKTTPPLPFRGPLLYIHHINRDRLNILSLT